jgi:hypothetical protein
MLNMAPVLRRQSNWPRNLAVLCPEGRTVNRITRACKFSVVMTINNIINIIVVVRIIITIINLTTTTLITWENPC